jgi:5-methylcytosine-specific restriction endonuclease McrA
VPGALLRPCAGIACPNLVEAGRCPACRRGVEATRGSAASRGYDAGWRRFKVWFIHQLIKHGIVPACGARWPGQPSTGDSRCHAEGRLVADDLHLDHTPPLTDAERHDPRAVCDPLRVQLLCESCHNTKTNREHSGRAA